MRFIRFIRKPRNLYFCIIAMLTIVTGLVSVSFSYYIGSSNNKTKLALSIVDNEIQCDALDDGNVVLAPNESKTFNVYLISNNNFESLYKLYYVASDNIKVTVDNVYDSLEPHDVKLVKVTVSSYSDILENVHIDIASGYMNTNIEVDGKEIRRA